MSNIVQEIKVYLLGKDEPKIIRDSVDGFHKRIYHNTPKTNSWRPLHRSNSPAVEYEDGGFEWWNNGLLHRTNGPALWHPSTDTKSYYLCGNLLDKKIYDLISYVFSDSSKYNELYERKFSGWIIENKVKMHMSNGILHSEHGPSIILNNKIDIWFANGLIHRLDGPAIIGADGSKEFWMYGKRGRAEKFAPVVISRNKDNLRWMIDDHEVDLDGLISYAKSAFAEDQIIVDADKLIFIKDGVPHNDDGPAVIWFNGTIEWYVDGKLSRDTGPAIISHNGSRMWYKNGVRHRTDGPAVEFPSKRKAWYVDGLRVRRGDFQGKVDEFKEKEIVLQSVESILEQINSLHAEKTVSGNGNVESYLEDVDNIFNKILHIDLDLDNIKLHIDEDVDRGEECIAEEVEQDNSNENEEELGWGLPILSMAVATLMGVAKYYDLKKEKPKKKELVVSKHTQQEHIYA